MPSFLCFTMGVVGYLNSGCSYKTWLELQREYCSRNRHHFTTGESELWWQRLLLKAHIYYIN